MFKKIAILGMGAVFLFACGTRAVDPKKVEKDSSTSGVVGWIHASVPEQGLYVLTTRNPNDFFDATQISLISRDPGIQNSFRLLHRHDKVRVQGAFLANPSPQKHLRVTSIETLKPYESGYPTDPYAYEASIPQDLQGLSNALFLVHAVAGDGHILVVEYKDAVIPIFVRNASLTHGLFRNDLVELQFAIQGLPRHPTHLKLDEQGSQALRVVDSIHSRNGKPVTIEGALVLFPKSPEIIFNVFAVQEVLPAGLKRQYTLVNFKSSAEFAKIRDALQKAWDRHPGDYVNGRNKLVSTRIRIQARGILNEVDPGQANPQILLDSVDSMRVLEDEPAPRN